MRAKGEQTLELVRKHGEGNTKVTGNPELVKLSQEYRGGHFKIET